MRDWHIMLYDLLGSMDSNLGLVQFEFLQTLHNSLVVNGDWQPTLAQRDMLSDMWDKIYD